MMERANETKEYTDAQETKDTLILKNDFKNRYYLQLFANKAAKESMC